MKKIIFFLVMALSMLIVGCGKETEKVVKETLVVAQGADARSLDPHKAIDTPSVRVYQQIYDDLVEKDEHMNIVPGLAESWEIVDNKTTIFHLREGVKFHNGEILTAEDVKFTFERMKEQPTVSFLVTELDKIEVIDDYTVKITTKNGFGPLLSHLSHPGAGILNKKAVLEAGDTYGQHPVGTGAFVFSEWQAGDKIILTANKDYFLGEPAIKKLTFKSIPEGTNRAIALETGDADIAYDIEAIDIENVKNNKNLVFLIEPSLGNSYLTINTKQPPFDNVKVRQALAYAINAEDIKSVVYKNTAEVANSPICPMIPGYNKDAMYYDYNIEKAKELLAEAGYPDGFKTSIWINDNNARKDIATILQAQFKEIGIDATIDVFEWGAYLDRTAKGEHSLSIMGWVTVTGDADYGLYPVFHSSAHGRPGNRSFYTNPEVDKLLDFARTSVNQEERLKAYEKVQEIVQEELPIYTMVNISHNVALQKGLKGFIINPTGYYELYKVNYN